MIADRLPFPVRRPRHWRAANPPTGRFETSTSSTDAPDGAAEGDLPDPRQGKGFIPDECPGPSREDGYRKANSGRRNPSVSSSTANDPTPDRDATASVPNRLR